MLGGLILFVASPEQAGQLGSWIGRMWTIVGIWLVAGPLWESGSTKAETARR